MNMHSLPPSPTKAVIVVALFRLPLRVQKMAGALVRRIWAGFRHE
jgi:hypothetical protein